MCIYKGKNRPKWFTDIYIDEMSDAYLYNAMRTLTAHYSLDTAQRIMYKALMKEHNIRKSRRHAERYGLRGAWILHGEAN